MKRILMLLTLASIAIACNNVAENEYELSGTVDPALNGKKITLEKLGGPVGGFVPVDTAVVQNGKFKFHGTTTQPELHFLNISDLGKKVDFILENGAIDIDVDKDSIQKSVRKGTKNNEKLQDYYMQLNEVQSKGLAFQRKNLQAMLAARQANDTATIRRLGLEYQSFGKKIEKKGIEFVEKNPDTYITVLLIKTMATSGRVPFEDIKKYYNNLTAEMKKTREGKEIAEMIKNSDSPAAIGKPAPDFTAPTPEGKKVSLRQSMGKVTIIDFWASWCGPCRRENPNVVAIYNDFHNKGLNIISVSLDKPGQADKWKQAIAADKLTWTHVSNLMEWEDPIAKQYGVTGIPATFILDSKGIIVAKDLRGAELRAKIDELLNAASK